MFQRNRTARAFRAKGGLLLCATLGFGVTAAAPPALQSVAVTPAASSIAVGQKQFFAAKGTFSDGSTHILMPDVANPAPGYAGTCVLLTSGGIKCWGKNDYGQLGDGTTTASLAPRPVKWITQATAVSFLYAHACALLRSGEVQCWGQNQSGQLGNGTTARYSSWPVQVPGIKSATALGVGWENSCALLASGEVQCWGLNSSGELGNGTNLRSSIPVRVAGISTATALGTGAMHSCALLAGGAVQCWGNNYEGELGNGTTTNANTPVYVTGINDATAIAVGWHYSCALVASGTVKCWGNNYQGELGNSASSPYVDHSNVPVTIAGINSAVAITAGGFHICATLANGSAWCWGDNSGGQLGNGLTTAATSSTPVRVMEIPPPARLVAGPYHTCALLADGAMRCWGWDDAGQLGNRRKTNLPIRWPVNVIGTPGVLWQSSDRSRATINGSGLAVARAPGNTTITAATAGSINDNAVLTVE